MRFVVIGGIAAVLRGSPIVTQDLDIGYARDDANLHALAEAFGELRARPRGDRGDAPFKLDARTR